MNADKTVTFDQFAARYCERQESTPDTLRATLEAQHARYSPDGWVMLECAVMDSSRCGELTILPYGPQNTYKTIPDHPISPRGLASDMSTVVAIMLASELWIAP